MEYTQDTVKLVDESRQLCNAITNCIAEGNCTNCEYKDVYRCRQLLLESCLNVVHKLVDIAQKQIISEDVMHQIADMCEMKTQEYDKAIPCSECSYLRTARLEDPSSPWMCGYCPLYHTPLICVDGKFIRCPQCYESVNK